MSGKMRFTSILALLALLSVMAFGQAETGQIIGTVTDPQGAVVAGAKVTIVNVGTTASRSTVTNSNGLYTISNLQPADYDVKVEAANFAPKTKRVNVSVGSRNTVDFPLTVGGAATTVEVVGEGGVAVETTQQQLSQEVTGKQITELPTLTRNAYSLVGTAGNVSGNDPSGRGAGFAINGQRAASTDLLLDGGENVDEFVAGVGQNTPLDSIGEFRVITSNFSAEYGRASGGVVNVSTKSGTNAFHGSLFEFYRGAGFSSNTYDNNANGVAKANFVRNQFGYSIGGPVLKDKLFFFSSTEWIRVRSNSNVIGLVPTASFIAASNAATQAFFTAYGAVKPDATLLGTFTAADVAASACPGAGTFCTFAAGSPAANVFNLISYPVPANSGGGDPRNEFQSVQRVDFNWTDKTQMYGRWAWQKQDFFNGTTSNSPYVGFDTGTTFEGNNVLFNLTHIWGPSVVTQSKVIFNRLTTNQPLNGDPTPTLYMKGGSTQRFAGDRIALPGYLPFSPGSGIPFGGPQNLYQFYQDVNWTVGKHQFRFGGQYIHTRDNRTFGAYETASEILGGGLRTGLNHFMDGQLTQFQTAVDPQGKFPCPTDRFGAVISTPACHITLPAVQPRFDRANRYHDFAFYAQDSWKVHPRFTLNMGVRWEYYGVQHNNDPSFDSNFYLGPGANYFEQVRNGLVHTSTDPANPIGGLWSPDYNNWAPRIGFAWDLFGDGKTSLRGGYGISYERNFGNVTFNAIQNPPNYAVISIFQGSSCAGVCPIDVNNLGPLSGAVGTVNMPKTSLRAPKQDLTTAYAHFWSLSIEREVAKNTVAALEYSGSRGVDLYSIENPNRTTAGPLYLGDNPADQAHRRLNDQYTGFNRRGQTGNSKYHALNVRVQTNNLHNTGLSFVSNYTWSHSIDNLSSTFSEAGNNFNLGYLDPFLPNQDRGDADFDIRHRWVFSSTWDTPWFKNDSNWAKKNILGGWTFAPIISVQSGGPFTVWDCSAFRDEVCQRWTPTGAFTRSPSGVDCSGPAFGGNVFAFINLGAFTPADCPAAGPALGANTFINPVSNDGQFGQCGVGQGAISGCPFPGDMTGRNFFRSPGFWNIDLGIYKNIHVTERFTLQFRSEFYNAFNHSNMYIQGSDTDVASGWVIGKKGGFANSATDERRNIQFGLRLLF